MEQASLETGKIQATELVMTLDLRNITLLDGSIRVELADDHIILSTIKKIGMNIVALSNDTLHALHAALANELRAREQCALNFIS